MKQDARFTMQDSRFRTITYSFIFCIVFILSFHDVSYAASDYAGGSGEELFLSESPPTEHKGGGHRHKGGDEHSEHMPTPMKRVYLNTRPVSEATEVQILRADGSLVKGSPSYGEDGLSIEVDTVPMDYTMDGIFNVYVIDREVIDETLIVKVAKMNVIHHSCGWGHRYRNDPERLKPKHLSSVPLEIKGYGFWDNNFHTKTMVGDVLKFTIFNNGMPVTDAKVKVRMESGWVKTFKTDKDGNFSVQLIRDYYPERWTDFNKRKRGRFLVTAEYEKGESGVFNGIPYSRVKMITTLPWKYQPQRKEYTSYLYGMLITVSASMFTFWLVYYYRLQRRRPYEYEEIRFNER